VGENGRWMDESGIYGSYRGYPISRVSIFLFGSGGGNEIEKRIGDTTKQASVDQVDDW
jgi:hypothetical protein